MLEVKYARLRPRCAALAVLLVSTCLACPPASAADEHQLLDRFSFTLGGFFSTTNTDLRLDGPTLGRGDRFDLENDLAFDETDTLIRFGADFRIKRRHMIHLGYYELNRSSTTVLTRDIQFRDRVFPVEAEVTAFFDTQVVGLSYTYWLVMKDKMVFGLTAGGANFFAFDLGMDLAGAQVDLVETASTDVPVPLFGLEVRRALAPKWMLRAGGRFIAISGIEGYSGDVIDVSAALEYRVQKNFAIGAGFSAVRMDIDKEERSFTGAIEYDIRGAQVFFRVGL